MRERSLLYSGQSTECGGGSGERLEGQAGNSSLTVCELG